jgi:hypothetical protein
VHSASAKSLLSYSTVAFKIRASLLKSFTKHAWIPTFGEPGLPLAINLKMASSVTDHDSYSLLSTNAEKKELPQIFIVEQYYFTQ